MLITQINYAFNSKFKVGEIRNKCVEFLGQDFHVARDNEKKI